MVVCQGKSVLKGIAIGKIYLYEKQEYVLEQKQVADAEAEVARFEAAKETAIGQLDDLYEKALAEAGEEQAMIFDVHKMMLDDGDYLDAITGLIRSEKVNAEYAVHTTGEQFAAVFASMDDDYMKARSADVKDISGRVIRILAGIGDGSIASEEPVILLADDLTPSETVCNPQRFSKFPYSDSGTFDEYSGIGADRCGAVKRIPRHGCSCRWSGWKALSGSGRGCACRISSEKGSLRQRTCGA